MAKLNWDYNTKAEAEKFCAKLNKLAKEIGVKKYKVKKVSTKPLKYSVKQ